MSWRGMGGFMLRATVAVVAIGYLLHAMTWRDRVVLPAGFVSAGTVLSRTGGDFPVVAQHGDRLQLEVDEQGLVELPVAGLGERPGDAHFRAGILHVLGHARLVWLVGAMVMINAMVLVQALRWWLLLRARRFALSFAQALRLHLIGCLWNCLFPGLTGGDAVKAWHVAQAGGGRLADAIMSVVIDRILGLLALVCLCAVAGLMLSDNPAHQQLVLRIWVVVGAVAVAIAFWMSSTLRRATGFVHLLRWARARPRLDQVIDALAAYRGHTRTLLWGFMCSCIGHLLIIGGTIIAGRALGIVIPWSEMMVILSIVFLIGALPISLFGLGVMEVAAVALFGGGASANQIVSMLVVTRLALLFSALPGGWFVMLGHGQWKTPAQVGTNAEGTT